MLQLIQITGCALKHKTAISTTPTTTTCAPASLRVPLYTNNNTQQTRSMAHTDIQVPRLSTPSVPRVEHSTKTIRKHRTNKHRNNFHTTSPAHNTRSRTQADEAPPVSRTRARTQLTILENKIQTGQAYTVDAAIAQLENDYNQVLAIMDKDTGKLLSYRQLMRNPKFKNNWSTSSKNEFGRLANGVGGRIKNPTNTIEFITRNDIPHNRRKYVTYGQFVCSVRREGKKRTEQDSQ